MKTMAISSFFVLFALAAGVFSPAAFADHSEVTIEPTAGSVVPGCEDTAEGCYIPRVATIDVGGTIIMSNTDAAAHTFTAGNARDGASGKFDSGILLAGGSFEYSPNIVGEIDYYCAVHPWMTGLIIVQDAEGADNGHGHTGDPMMRMDDASKTGMLSDGTKVLVKISAPTTDETLDISIEYTDAEHVNHDLTVTQNGDEVLHDEGAHSHDGKYTHTTNSLSSADPIDITIIFQGYGIDDPKTGPIGEQVVFTNIVLKPIKKSNIEGLPPLILKSPSDKSITLTESDKPYYLHNIKLSDFLVTDDSGETPTIECQSEQAELERKTRVTNYSQNSYTNNNHASITFDQISNKADFNPNNNRIQYMGVAFALPAGEHEIICFIKDNESNTVEVKHTVRIISDALAPSWVKTVAGWYTQNLIDQPTYLKVVKYFQLAKVITFDIDNAKNIPDINSMPSNFKSETRQWTEGSLSNTEYKEKLEELADKGIFENINLFENIKPNGDKMKEDKTIKEIIPTKYTGTFIGVNDGIHNAEGDAYTIPQKDGSAVLRLENFKSTNGPDLYVYLATDNSASDFVNLGELKANRGNQNYEIPNNTDLTKYNKVLIWCKSFSVLFGSAEISPQT